MFIFDTFIYIIFAAVMACLATKSNRISLHNRSSEIQWNRYLVAYVLFFVFISAIRYGVGSDSISYARFFKYGIPQHTLEERSNEFLWIGFVNFIHGNGIHFTIGVGAIVLMQIYFILKGTKEFNYLLISMPIVLFSGRFYLELMNGMRQMLVACAFIYASRWIVERKFWRYFIFLWIAHYVHNSALILIPLYFIPVNFTLATKKTLCIIILLLCLILGQVSPFKGIIPYIEGYVNLIGYGDYVNIITNKLTDKSQAEVMSFGITMISYFLMSLSVILFSDKLRYRYGKENAFFDLWYNYSFYYSCGFFLFCNISHIFLRPFLYFEMFLMIMLALILNYCWEGKSNKLLIKRVSNNITCIAVLVILWIGLFWTIYKVSSTGVYETIIYKTIFSHSI